ncbi:hypothetical protein PVL29_007667 [Vitis rotundifolia]|uniref:Uncharacterized protein n=1 Tax=Vitis rotundifolia TaxID=103349 RepID=A0AA39A2G4_VITRO|nr:hypothetical protein PVL29_007667 [Vitis rotundifolia]
MVSGKPAWEDCGADTLFRIGFSDELPKFPAQLSDLGRDFLEKCLRREPTERWSCDQLLQHPFISSSSPNYITDASPRSVLDCFNFSDDDDEETELNPNPAPKNSVSAHDRIRKLASNRGPVWESEIGWTSGHGSVTEQKQQRRAVVGTKEKGPIRYIPIS